MNTRTAAVAILLLGSVGWSAGQAPLQVLTARQNGVPVLLSGTVTPADSRRARVRYSYKVSISATNVSDKSILLMITRVDINRELGEDNSLSTTERSLTTVDDDFFSSSLFDPGATRCTEDFDPAATNMPGHSLAPFGDAPFDLGAEPPKTAAVASVLFVQFADGSTWGDRKAAEEALHERSLTVDRLTFLEEVYRTKGEQPFLIELLKPSQPVTVAALQELYREKKDAALVIARLTAMLHDGDMHFRGMGGWPR
jgi:hypothetical protein